MMKTPKGNRLHIAIVGRRNAGKSSLLNAILQQDVSIVSNQPGTTTDPVEKPMELLPLGPVVFVDTAGLDDDGTLGELRIQKTRNVFERTDLAILVAGSQGWEDFEEQLLVELKSRNIPTVVVFNKCDIQRPTDTILERLQQEKTPTLTISALRHEGIAAVKEAILQNAPDDFLKTPPILGDLVQPGDLVVMVTPIDQETPKGRLILPQVQAIRDALDADAMALVVKERELASALSKLKTPPALVVTDSQAFMKVAADVPSCVPMTSFSILFARQKGDLRSFIQGALAIDKLKSGDTVIIAEACSHHPMADDIGRAKIPRWLQQYVGGSLHFEHVRGHDFPTNLMHAKLVVHCGGCMHNRREMLSRLARCNAQGIPMTNYGLAIAYSLGIFDRALQPFAGVRDLIN
jgi:[FeFe] hydrogenase H-cluster maturation GTPase HydF